MQPNGLALSGEVEDYAMQILPGLPPQIGDVQESQDVTSRKKMLHCLFLTAAGKARQATKITESWLALSIPMAMQSPSTPKTLVSAP